MNSLSDIGNRENFLGLQRHSHHNTLQKQKWKKKNQTAQTRHYSALNCRQKILLNRWVLTESQYGFRANQIISDIVFALKQIQESCQEQDKRQYITIVYLTDKDFEKHYWNLVAYQNFLKWLRASQVEHHFLKIPVF